MNCCSDSSIEESNLLSYSENTSDWLFFLVLSLISGHIPNKNQYKNNTNMKNENTSQVMCAIVSIVNSVGDNLINVPSFLYLNLFNPKTTLINNGVGLILEINTTHINKNNYRVRRILN